MTRAWRPAPRAARHWRGPGTNTVGRLGGQGKALRAILILIPTMLAIVYLTPLKGLVEDRFAHPHSNERRVGLYEEAIANVEQP